MYKNAYSVQMCGGIASCCTHGCQASARLVQELPLNMGEFILNNLKNNYFSLFLKGQLS